MKQEKKKLFRIIILFSGVGLVALFLSLGTPAEGGCGGEQQIEVQTGVAESQEKKGLKRGPSAEAPSAAAMDEYVGGQDPLPPLEDPSVEAGYGPACSTQLRRDEKGCKQQHGMGLWKCIHDPSDTSQKCPPKATCQSMKSGSNGKPEVNPDFGPKGMIPHKCCACCKKTEIVDGIETCIPCDDCATEL